NRKNRSWCRSSYSRALDSAANKEEPVRRGPEAGSSGSTLRQSSQNNIGFGPLGPAQSGLYANMSDRRRVDPEAPASGPLLTGSSLLAALSKAREYDERHQESRQDMPDQIMLQQ
nr:hypothetical protein [Tanacetum cinerariifolium]